MTDQLKENIKRVKRSIRLTTCKDEKKELTELLIYLQNKLNEKY